MSKKKQQSYSSFSQDNDTFSANPSHFTATTLKPGAYGLTYDGNTNKLYFSSFELASDQLLDLPTKEFHQVVDQIEVFLKPETKKLFEEYGYLYKRSALLWGSWGTGKTCIVARVAQQAIARGAVVLFNPDPRLVSLAMEQLESIQPETPCVVIFEELDKLVKKYEDTLLNLLDGEVQKSNIVYLATTNFINQIPARIKRPGRFSNVVEVSFPDAACRDFYLRHKLKNASNKEIDGWVETTDGLSIDELKETVLAVKCLGQDLKEVVNRVKEARTAGPEEAEDMDDMDFPPTLQALQALQQSRYLGGPIGKKRNET